MYWLLPNGLHMALGCNPLTNNNYNNNNSLNIKGDYPVGITNVIFTLTEGCDNTSSTFNFQIEVLDTVPITFDCVKTFPQMTDNLTAIDNVNDHFIVLGNCEEGLIITGSFSMFNVNDTIRNIFCVLIN
ncbi:MAG: hypothetical protein IPO92_05290 [Saprospiraceae bacterium]|nr:hypothetical protein [Saprospiraceae bacterium]